MTAILELDCLTTLGIIRTCGLQLCCKSITNKGACLGGLFTTTQCFTAIKHWKDSPIETLSLYTTHIRVLNNL